MTNKRVVVSVLICLSSISGCKGKGNPNPSCGNCPSAYHVGYQELTFTDSTRGRSLRTAIWYPTVDGEENASRAFEGGTPNTAGQPYPLILFSHGDGARSTDGQADFQKIAWAGRGFVVAAPDHQKNTSYDFDDSDANRAAIQFDRPLDIRFVTDQMLLLNSDPSSFLHGMVDPESIGMSGGSFGGHTTLMISGATPNLDHLADYCQTNVDHWDICALQDRIQQLYPGQRIIDQSDPRMKAALAQAPDGYGWFREDVMANIKIPIMIMGVEKDTDCPLDRQLEPMYEGIVSTKYLLVLRDADHFAYGNGCCWWDWDTLPICSSLHTPIVLASTAFWMLHLKKNQVCGDMLRTCVPFQPGVELFSAVGDDGGTAGIDGTAVIDGAVATDGPLGSDGAVE